MANKRICLFDKPILLLTCLFPWQGDREQGCAVGRAGERADVAVARHLRPGSHQGRICCFLFICLLLSLNIVFYCLNIVFFVV